MLLTLNQRRLHGFAGQYKTIREVWCCQANVGPNVLQQSDFLNCVCWKLGTDSITDSLWESLMLFQ